MVTKLDLLKIYCDQETEETQRKILYELDELTPPNSPHSRSHLDCLKRLHFEKLLKNRYASTVPEKVSETRQCIHNEWRSRHKRNYELERRSTTATLREFMQTLDIPNDITESNDINNSFTQSPVPPAMIDKLVQHQRSITPQKHVQTSNGFIDSTVTLNAHEETTRPSITELLRPKQRDAVQEYPSANSIGDLNGYAQSAQMNNRQSNNPFQSARQKFDRDQIKERKRSRYEENQSNSTYNGAQNNSSRQSGPFRPKGYHPINSKVLMGGSKRQSESSLDFDDRNDSIQDRDHNDVPAITKSFVSPVLKQGEKRNSTTGNQSRVSNISHEQEEDECDPRLKSCDPELIAKIEMEIVDSSDPVTFDDIAGLHSAKKCVNELVIWPMARPDIFTGLRSLPKGLLLFGPPGTGKTLIGKAIANQSGATFFSISASSLTSKWIGEGEKLVRTLFAVAQVRQPSVIFIDEIDALLSQRSSTENEASRRMKTEFLVQLDGAGTKAKDVILVVGATNRPQELDEAARRRFVKRLYIPLPSFEARYDMISRLLKNNQHDLTEEMIRVFATRTKGYSGADVRALCTEAAMGPIRSCHDIRTIRANDVRPINSEDFEDALRGVRASVGSNELDFYREWNDEYGSFAFTGHTD